MIHKIYSDLIKYKEMRFKPGLNIVLSETTSSATSKQTRNRAGKSSLVEVIHFLTGADCSIDSLFRHSRLENQYFGMVFDLGDQIVDVRRTGVRPGVIEVVDGDFSEWVHKPDTDILGIRSLLNSKWRVSLADLMFRLSVKEASDKDDSSDKSKPIKPPAITFRMPYSYFARRQSQGGFSDPFASSAKQQIWDRQTCIMFLIGLDYTIALEWEQVRKQEKIIRTIAPIGLPADIADIKGMASQVSTLITLRENQAEKMIQAISHFQVLDNYPEMESEVAELSRLISSLVNENTLDRILLSELKDAITEEAPPTYSNVAALYREVSVVLPQVVLNAFDDVVLFHQSVIANRRLYLQDEINAAEGRIGQRDKDVRRKEQRKSKLLRILSSHGAFDQLATLNSELARVQTEIASLRVYSHASEDAQRQKAELKIDRANLLLRLKQNLSEQENHIKSLVVRFSENSNFLYEEQVAGLFTISGGENGPEFKASIQGSRSKGVNNMQIFCFDLLVACYSAEHKIGPRYLVHDSHLFDGVDLRQVAKALELGAKMADKYSFQYIVTLNSDALSEPKWFPEDFDVNQYIVQPRLTDSTEDGGLFGFRFN